MGTLMTTEQRPLIARFAGRFGVEEGKVFDILKATAFKTKDGPPSDAQMTALLIVADQYGLNPFTKEIYAFPDKQNGIVPVVGVDGWSRIINTNDQFDGMEFVQSDAVVSIDGDAKQCPEWIECRIYRKDRGHAIAVREFLDETYRAAFKGKGQNGAYTVAGPWQSHTKRMLRHKAMIQCARIAFGFVGIYDEDEAERIVEGQYTDVTAQRAAQRPGQAAVTRLAAPDSPERDQLIKSLKDVATLGAEALSKEWERIGKDSRKLVADKLEEFKAIAAEADVERANEEPA